MKSQLIISITALILVGCNEDNSHTSAGNDPTQISENVPIETTKEAINELVKSGVYPSLDTSDSLAGSDTDDNGIRDDISRYIDNLSISDLQKLQVKSVAKSIQASIIADVKDFNSVESIDNDSTLAIGCLSRAFENPADAHRILKQLESYTANTKKRALAYAAYNEALDGTVTRLPATIECEGM